MGHKGAKGAINGPKLDMHCCVAKVEADFGKMIILTEMAAGFVDVHRLIVSEKTSEKASEKILDILYENGNPTIPEIAQLLLDNGAAPNTKSEIDWTPLKTALISGHQATADLLRSCGGEE